MLRVVLPDAGADGEARGGRAGKSGFGGVAGGGWLGGRLILVHQKCVGESVCCPFSCPCEVRILSLGRNENGGRQNLIFAP